MIKTKKYFTTLFSTLQSRLKDQNEFGGTKGNIMKFYVLM